MDLFWITHRTRQLQVRYPKEINTFFGLILSITYVLLPKTITNNDDAIQTNSKLHTNTNSICCWHSITCESNKVLPINPKSEKGSILPLPQRILICMYLAIEYIHFDVQKCYNEIPEVYLEFFQMLTRNFSLRYVVFPMSFPQNEKNILCKKKLPTAFELKESRQEAFWSPILGSLTWFKKRCVILGIYIILVSLFCKNAILKKIYI